VIWALRGAAGLRTLRYKSNRPGAAARYGTKSKPMLTAAYAISLAFLALAVWWLRAKKSVRAARWSLWLGFLLALVAFKGRWVPINLVTFAALVGFFLYFMIQGIRIEKTLADPAAK